MRKPLQYLINELGQSVHLPGVQAPRIDVLSTISAYLSREDAMLTHGLSRWVRASPHLRLMARRTQGTNYLAIDLSVALQSCRALHLH